MQVHIKSLSGAALDTVQRTTYTFEGRYSLDSVPVSVIFRLIQIMDDVLLQLKIMSYIQR